MKVKVILAVGGSPDGRNEKVSEAYSLINIGIQFSPLGEVSKKVYASDNKGLQGNGINTSRTLCCPFC